MLIIRENRIYSFLNMLKSSLCRSAPMLTRGQKLVEVVWWGGFGGEIGTIGTALPNRWGMPTVPLKMELKLPNLSAPLSILPSHTQWTKVIYRTCHKEGLRYSIGKRKDESPFLTFQAQPGYIRVNARHYFIKPRLNLIMMRKVIVRMRS